jgi:hypothetical protein
MVAAPHFWRKWLPLKKDFPGLIQVKEPWAANSDNLIDPSKRGLKRENFGRRLIWIKVALPAES